MALLMFLSLDKFLLLRQPQFVFLPKYLTLCNLLQSFDKIISCPNPFSLTFATTRINISSYSVIFNKNN